MSLAMEQESIILPKVAGRVVLVDGDILAYHCGYNNDEPLDECQKTVGAELGNIMAKCRADSYRIAVTGKHKGGRYAVAKRVAYQSRRQKGTKPLNVEPLKQYMVDELGATMTDEEADDLLSQWQLAAGANDSSVIWTTDKDLGMVNGWHYDKKAGLVYTKGYGLLRHDAKRKKVTGRGKSFFFFQTLAGDAVDTIPGIPTLFGKKCGPKRAYDYLKDCRSEEDALDKVIDAYYDCFGETWLDELLEQSRLLWMRRTRYEDVLTYFKELVDGSRNDERHAEIQLREVFEFDKPVDGKA